MGFVTALNNNGGKCLYIFNTLKILKIVKVDYRGCGLCRYSHFGSEVQTPFMYQYNRN